MLKMPKLKSHLHAEILGDRVLFIGEGRYFVVSGQVYARVVPMLDGRRSTDEIIELLLGEIPPAEIYHALLVLAQNGHVEEACQALPEGAAAFWNALGLDTLTAAEHLVAKAVCVMAIGEVPEADLRARLGVLGVREAREEEAHLAVALVDDYLQNGLEEINRRALATEKPWLIAKPNGIFSWVGPIFRPGHTGCWACLAQRLRANRDVEEFARRARERAAPYPTRGALPSTLDVGLGLVATEIAKWLVLGGSTALDGQLVTFDAISLQTQRHVLVRRPQCPACGAPERRAAEASEGLRLRSVPKTFVADGGHRAVSPEETLRKYEHHISPITGIAKSLVRITDQDGSPLHVYIAGNNLAAYHDSFQRLRRNLRSACCGKGTTDAQARASGLCEAIERYSGVFRGEEIMRRATARALGEQAIDPTSCTLYSEAQYRDRALWNARDRRLDTIPLPFDPGAEIDWTPLWSLTRRETRYLPTSHCYYSYPSPPERFFCFADSNGCAAGNTVEEAILQGFMELCERDSVAVWWYNRVRRPAVDLDSFDEPFIQRMKDHYRGLGRELWVLDLTGDLGVPAFVAISRRLGRAVEDIVFAPAAHFDARLGVLRALTELNQMIPGVSRGKPDGTGYAYDDPEAIHWWRTARIADHPYLSPDEAATPLRQRDYPSFHTDDIRDDVLRCQSIVERIGLEMLVLDQTRPDIGLPVVKVVVPGLRHFWARFAPGRLYDVPVRMGWLPRPLAESELNPVAIFI
ncbi:TOMM precursor leader peptide-binding protein [Polyangium sp. y55x31]|uniref:TOMM precursor leader peptide-binding protein n=1 Tax=Polyangium sp. y55x31 TaxID=3042688 RepID=UPI002482C3A9|nr:TOMM precursor leader peptide-binding protein [Polyangium sp. y55x31]MDI1480107.1 TOMM precursor leader peptide-binding protein [Polyangium sp. y55x31]